MHRAQQFCSARLTGVPLYYAAATERVTIRGAAKPGNARLLGTRELERMKIVHQLLVLLPILAVLSKS